MNKLLCFLFFLIHNLIGTVISQAERTYTCTLPSYCTSSQTIDPRILVPGQSAQQQQFPSAQQPQQGFPGQQPQQGAPGQQPQGFPGQQPQQQPQQQQGFPGQQPGPQVSIVTPASGSQTTCPSGYIQCPNANVVCGRTSVAISNTDGYATQNSFPWQAFLINNNNVAVRNGYAGGGVLLDQYHVLTAAHKVSNLTSISVAMGVYQSDSLAGAQVSQVSGVWIHSSFDIRTLRNDIAILRLANPVNIDSTTETICAPTSSQSIPAGTNCVVSGWGQTNFSVYDAPTQTLKQVHVPIVSYTTCRASFMSSTLLGSNTDTYLDQTGELCAGGGANQDACTQDGGSPLVCPSASGVYSLAGLVIWGKNCGLLNVYGVYVSAPAYLNWISCTRQCTQGTISCSNCPATRYL